MSETLERLTRALAGRYRIERKVGAGGMASVYLAKDLRHDRDVAIKVLHPELAAHLGAERFHQEIRITAGLRHPHILPLHDSGEAEGLLYYVMPYAEGETLRRLLDRERRLPLDRTLAIARDVAAALGYAHRHGVIHRDIKPDNILLGEGGAVVADFGIAIAAAGLDADRVTATGLAIGTPAYMSPEQLAAERELDGRSDVYALACVVYEMLAGEPPYAAPTARAIMVNRVGGRAKPLSGGRPDVGPALDRVLARALALAPEDRFPDPTALVDALAQAAAPRPKSRRALVATIAVAAVALAALVPLWRSRERANARALLPEIASLAKAGRYREAYALANDAASWLDRDTTLARLWPTIADTIRVTSEPAGARIELLGWTAGDTVVSHAPMDLGTAPLIREMPRGDYHLRITLDGFVPEERIASSEYIRLGPTTLNEAPGMALELRPADHAPPGMVPIPGGDYTIASPDMPLGLSVGLDDFWIDRFEVRNIDYLAFLRGGGYGRLALWPETMSDRETPLPRAKAMARLVDRTGLPGPREWFRQSPPEGWGDHPVTGVSWYEARAYCLAQGKRLPTIYQWEKAARDGKRSRLGLMMPWGAVSAAGRSGERANFNGAGTLPVDAHPLGISQYGVYAMAGNVKEWQANPAGDGYLATGGSWQDPGYIFSEYGEYSGMYASPALGFRCVTTGLPGSDPRPAARIEWQRSTPEYHPVDRATFDQLLTHYRYDRHPLDPRIVDTIEAPDWTRETVRFNGIGGDSILAYVFLPRHVAPPYQPLVLVPGSNAFFINYLREEVERVAGGQIQGGRAILAVALKGMKDRPWPEVGWPEPQTVQFRDMMVHHATELRLGIDYLETRGDMAMDKLGYLALSLGAGSRLPFAAVDDRFRAVVLIGGGIDERLHPTLPEASNINFAPYIAAPTLLINGHQDEEHPWLTRGLPLWNLLSEPKDSMLIDGAGHIPPDEVRVPAINRWLDSVLGPAGPRGN